MRTPTTGRGLHPAVTSDTVHLWPLDESAVGAHALDLASSLGGLTFPGGGADPALAPGNIGNALSFNGLAYVTGPTGDDAVLRGSWSFDAWVYTRRSVGTSYGSFASYVPVVPSELEADNDLFELGYDSQGRITWRWENGAGADIAGFTDATVPFEQWCHVAFVKEDKGATSDVFIYINGDLVDSFTGELSPTGGANSLWTFGLSTTGAHFGGVVSSMRVTAALLTAPEIRAAFRRGMAWEPGVFDTRLKVVVARGAFDDVNLSDFRGRDWVQSVEVSDTLDASSATATISVSRDVFNNESLAPLMFDSPDNKVGATSPPNPAEPGPDELVTLPAIDLWHEIKVYAARVPLGNEAVTAWDYQQVFEGRVDHIGWANDAVVLTCRDKAAELIDKWVSVQAQEYGLPEPGEPMETTIQNILNNEAPGVILSTPISPGFQMLPFTPGAEPIMDTLKTIADIIGWAIRYRWSEDAGAFLLTLYDPGRDRLSVDAVFDADDYFKVDKMSTDLNAVRNAVLIVYKDLNNAPKSVERTAVHIPPFTSASITKYGLRWMSVSEKATEHIRREADAIAMADAILIDLMEPYANKGATMRAFWEVGVGDRVRFEPNGVHYSEALYGAVHAVRQRYEKGALTTSLDLRGRPASAHNRHLEKGAGPRTGLYVPPTSLDDVTTHIGDRMRSIPAEAMLDQGLPAPVLTDAAVTTPNPYFSVHLAYDTRPFDGWTVDGANVWGAGGDVYWTETEHESGDRSMTLLTPGAAIVSIIYQPVILGRCMRLSCRWMGEKVTDNLVGEIAFYDGERALLSTSTAISVFPTAINTFQSDSGTVSPPAGARWATIRLSQGSAVVGTITVDRVTMTPALPELFAYLPADQTAIAAGTSEKVELDDTQAETYDYCGNFDAVSSELTVPERGRFVFAGNLCVRGNPGSVKIDNAHCFLYKNGVQWLYVASINLAGSGSREEVWLSWSTAPIEILGGDVVTMVARVDSDDFDIISGISKTWMACQLQQGRDS